MISYSQVLGSSGPCYQFEHKGQTYQVGMLNQKAKVAYEKWLLQQDMKAVGAIKDHVSPEDYAKRLDEIVDQAKDGYYSFVGEYAQDRLQQIHGIIALTSILFGLDEMEVIKLIAEARTEVLAIIKLVITESLPKVEAGNE